MRALAFALVALWGCASSAEDPRVPATVGALPTAGDEAPASGPAPLDVRALLGDAERWYVPLEGRPARGPATAPVTVVVFSDFQCPYCARGATRMEALGERFPDQLRIVFRQMPLNSHAHARPAARVALEARAQRGDVGFWTVHDLLFAQQPQLARPDLERLAASAGLDLPAVARVLDDAGHEAEIVRDLALARALGIRGTPTFFLNGRRVRGAQSVEVFADIVREELEVARALLDVGVAPEALYERIVREGRRAT